MPKPFRPSNGEMGELFMERFCEDCIHDDWDKGKSCEIITNSMIYEANEPEYPSEWIWQDEPLNGRGLGVNGIGYAVCTRFEPE